MQTGQAGSKVGRQAKKKAEKGRQADGGTDTEAKMKKKKDEKRDRDRENNRKRDKYDSRQNVSDRKPCKSPEKPA